MENLSHDKLLPPCNALLLPFPSLLHPLLILPTRVAREENKASPKTTRFKRLPGFDRSRMAFQCSHLASATSLLAYSLAAKVSQSSLLESGRLNFHRAALSREFVVTCFPIMEARSNLQDFSQFLREKFLDSLWNGKIKESQRYIFNCWRNF